MPRVKKQQTTQNTESIVVTQRLPTLDNAGYVTHNTRQHPNTEAQAENSTEHSIEHDSNLFLKVIYCSVEIICIYSTHTHKRDVKGTVVVGSSALFENVQIPEPQP